MMNSVSSNSPLLFISFFVGIPGNCPAEWADDKLRVLEKTKRKTFVLTGVCSNVVDKEGVYYYRIPSLSWNDYKYELNEVKKIEGHVPLLFYFFIPFSFVFGGILDFFITKITKGISSGRWSWLITALPVVFWLRLRYGIRDVFCTGGPTAAHILGAISVFFLKGRLFCEFQDPLLGATMNRSSATRRIAVKIEKWLVKNSHRLVFVTKEAAKLARERSPHYAQRILAIYPGAWNFFSQMENKEKKSSSTWEFLHLGTLYGTRNLDLFFQALDSLREKGFDLADKVRVVNLGAVYCDNKTEYLQRADFQSLDGLERVKALQRAQQASCLLLVQHNDIRSHETIPYKTYDYLNLDIPIFGVLKNAELKQIIENANGYTGKADDVNSIEEALRVCLMSLNDGMIKRYSDNPLELDISQQFLKILE